jgi:hypothetical protein
MLFLPKLTALLTSVALSAGLLIAGFTLLPTAQDPGQQTALFTGAVVTTTTQAATVACPQGAGSIGRKTLAVHNAGAGAVTVTIELRDYQAGPNITSGYLAVSNLASGLASTDVATPAEAGGAFCRVSAVSASTSTITVTLRRE